MGKIRKVLPQILAAVTLVLLWQAVYELKLFPALLFPSVGDIFGALWGGLTQKQMGLSILYSLYFIFRGLFFGCGITLIFTSLAMGFVPIRKIYTMLISLFEPLPGLALLPLAILWFGIGENTIIFLLIHSVVWPLSRSILDGFSTVPVIYVESGRNYGLRGPKLVLSVYFPAALPYILSGIKAGWARAWRALIGAEMIFGVSGHLGGIGWYIFTSRYKLDTPGVYASLIAIIIIGLVIEHGVFGTIENKTIRKWGTVR